MVIKRNGEEVQFELQKIVNAITKANNEVSNEFKINDNQILNIALLIEKIHNESLTPLHVEDIQDLVEEYLGKFSFHLAKTYMIYRYQHQVMRQDNDFDKKILSIIRKTNEEIQQENANKNANLLSTQRDYIAGEVCKRICKNHIYPKHLMKMHEEGLIHKHDLDYVSMNMHNCSLINLDDMLQNGTTISNVKIDKPHSFSTACNIATQVIAQVASSQYGGSTINILHLAKFVDVSRQKFKRQIERIFKTTMSLKGKQDELLNNIVEARVKEDITKGVQVIQYQILTLMTTNG